MPLSYLAVNQVGDGLEATAVSKDGVVEVLEFAGNKFGVFVRWYFEQDFDDLRIFRAFI